MDKGTLCILLIAIVLVLFGFLMAWILIYLKPPIDKLYREAKERQAGLIKMKGAIEDEFIWKGQPLESYCFYDLQSIAKTMIKKVGSDDFTWNGKLIESYDYKGLIKIIKLMMTAVKEEGKKRANALQT